MSPTDAPPRAMHSVIPPVDEYTSGITKLSTPPGAPRRRRGSVTISLEAQSILSARSSTPADARGAARLLGSTLGLGPRSTLMLLVSTDEEASLGAAFLTAANELGVHPAVYLVDPTDLATPAFHRRLAIQLQDMAACVAVQGAVPFPPELRELIATHPAAVVVDVPSDAVARQVLRADLDELHRLGLTLIRRAAGAREVEITSGVGLTLTATLDGGVAPLHYGGEVAPGAPLHLPAGQVLFHCAQIDGSIASDGGVWLEDGEVIGRGTATHIEIERGRITRAVGADAGELNALLERDPALAQVSALGFGTNTSLVAGVGAREIDLCLPGVHLMLGEASEPRARVALVPRRPSVRAGDEAWMVRGKWARELA